MVKIMTPFEHFPQECHGVGGAAIYKPYVHYYGVVHISCRTRTQANSLQTLLENGVLATAKQ